jgi:hypothetical protein
MMERVLRYELESAWMKAAVAKLKFGGNCISSCCLAATEYGCYLKEWLISVVIMPFS